MTLFYKDTVVVLAALAVLVSGQTALGQNLWTDKSPHKSAFVTANGIKLHYLDWGGKGKVVLFLAGVGNSAHIFDDLAPKFTDRYHVLALTRRGHGKSDSPTTGYDLPNLVEDIRLFLDQLQIKRVTLVGHSFAGDEMTRFATLFPDRVDKLVYLDAAYDKADLSSPAFSKNPFPSPPPTKEERASVAGYRNWWTRNRGFWSEAVEADLRDTAVAPDGTIKGAISRETGQGIFKNGTEYRPDYSKVNARALSIYVTPSVPLWVPPDEASQTKAREFINNANLPYVRKNIKKFREEMRNGRVVEISNSHHYVFIKSADQVVREMRNFLR